MKHFFNTTVDFLQRPEESGINIDAMSSFHEEFEIVGRNVPARICPRRTTEVILADRVIGKMTDMLYCEPCGVEITESFKVIDNKTNVMYSITSVINSGNQDLFWSLVLERSR